jgi:hypothetical protein
MTPLASLDDLAARIGRDLTSQESARAPALLGDASAIIRSYCKKDFLYHPNEVLTLRESHGTVKIPYRPVISVASVIAKSGRNDIPDIPVTWYVFDGIDEIKVMDATASGVINLPEAWYMYGTFPGTFLVTVTHGYAEIPPVVNAICANVTLAVLMAPTMAAGVVGETVGPYSYRVERSGGGITVALSQSDFKALDEGGFRNKFGTIQVGGR